MTEQWQELKETIIELRDNDGTCTQQEVCKFLANYMDILEKQISNSENPNKCFDGMPKGKVMNLVLRKTFPRTIFIRGIDECNKTKSIVYSEEWENEPYKAD